MKWYPSMLEVQQEQIGNQMYTDKTRELLPVEFSYITQWRSQGLQGRRVAHPEGQNEEGNERSLRKNKKEN